MRRYLFALYLEAIDVTEVRFFRVEALCSWMAWRRAGAVVDAWASIERPYCWLGWKLEYRGRVGPSFTLEEERYWSLGRSVS